MPLSERLPTVVIVGRPNVGKSTLFNAITGTRRSIVGDEPGITRDRIYSEAVYNRKHFEVIDTGGIIPNDEELIPSEILRQARVALEEAAQILFVIDGRTEITSADRDLAKMLRSLGKPVTLAVNKIDTPANEGLIHEFHALGFKDVWPVSAEHKVGVRDLLDHITRDFPAKPPKTEEEEKEEQEGRIRQIKVAIIGRPNAGKSTLLNALTGQERAIVSPVAGTTRDAVDETVEREGVEYVFVDTAGIRRKGKTKLMAEKLSVVMARRHIRMAHVVVLVMDATEGVLGLDATIAGYALEEGRALVLCVNKWDISPERSQKKFTEQVREELKFIDYAPLAFISAITGKGIDKLFPLIKSSYEAASKRVTTGELNRFVETLNFEPEMKVYYMTQPAIRPPTFVLFTNKTKNMHFSRERFIINQIRKRFGFQGTPIVLKLKSRHGDR